MPGTRLEGENQSLEDREGEGRRRGLGEGVGEAEGREETKDGGGGEQEAREAALGCAARGCEG